MRRLIEEFVLQPGTGKAFEVKKGQVIRLEQIEGGQCLDFNCFNLDDYKEFFHCGRTRTLHGIHPTKGHFLWSAPPRERAMMYILADTVNGNDVTYPRCSAAMYESVYGFDAHTNCQDIQAEAQREYGLTPDDVHDSFNLFMCTGVDENGRLFVTRQTSKPGDHVEFLALMDVLAVPNICGSDIMRTSNFAIRPAKVQIFEASAEDLAAVPPVKTLRAQRTVADFKVKAIRTERKLARDPHYQPEYLNTPIVYEPIEIVLDAEEAALLDRLARREQYGEDRGDALRDIVFTWWEETRPIG